jgi:hypothetical protein
MTDENKAANSDTHLGLLVEFEDEHALIEAAALVRARGFTRWDCHSPFPVHGIDEAMGIKQSKLPLLVIGGGFAGVGAGLLMQWWMVTVDYPYILSGKPFFSLPAFIPVMFELAILFGAFAAVFGMLFFNRLPKLYHPVFNSPRFRRASQDRFFIHIDAADPQYDAAAARAFAETLGAAHIESLEEYRGA